MAWLNYRGRVRVDPQNPRGYGVCDFCGIQYQLERLEYQTEWQGPVLRRTGFRQCPVCLDRPNMQLRTVILPPDPVPLKDPRPELYQDPAPGYPYNAAMPQPASVNGFPLFVLPPELRARLSSDGNLASDPRARAGDATGDSRPGNGS